MFKKRREEQDTEMNESWLLPYSDLMTLILALFIVLYAASRVDTDKLKAMSQAFQSVLSGGSGIMDGTTDEMKIFDGGDKIISDGNLSASPSPTAEPEQTEDTKQSQIEDLKKSIEKFLSENGMSGSYSVVIKDNMLIITLDSDVLFPSGSSKLDKEDKKIASRLTGLILDTQKEGIPMKIQVYGHTDNVPIHTAKYSSNWTLSLDRAASFLSAMIEGSDLDPRAFSAIGCGDLNPIASNDTASGRSKNRRVEITIIH